MSDRAVIVGVGSILMGDDGVGPAAVGELRRRGLDDRAELIDAGLAFSEVLCDLDPSQPLIVLDAIRGSGEPGSVYRLSLNDLDAAQGAMAHAVSLHEVSVLPALKIEALTGREFADVTIFGVEPGRLAWGDELSEPVAAAMDKLIEAVLKHVEELAADEHAACGSENR